MLLVKGIALSHTTLMAIKRALLSVSDKSGLIEFAQGLHGFGVEL